MIAFVLIAALIGIPAFLFTRSGGSEEPEALAPAEDSPNDSNGSQTCRESVDQLSLRSRLALLLMAGLDGDDLMRAEAYLTGTDRPGGIFVHSGTSVWEAGVFTAEREDLIPQIVAVDDEGGRVQPLKGVLGKIPSAASLAALDPSDVEKAAVERGAELQELGIDVVFAPVVDVGGGGGIGDRSFGDDPAVVTSHAGAYARGLRTAGVLPVLKHFPGHGRASADTHEASASTPSLDELREVDLKPYETLLSEKPVGVMVGHLDIPGLTADGIPASLSPAAIGLLRGAYEFDGIVFTDDIGAMDAVIDHYSTPEAAELALAAGVDMVLLARDTNVGAVLDRLTEAVEADRLSEARIDAALDRVAAASHCES